MTALRPYATTASAADWSTLFEYLRHHGMCPARLESVDHLVLAVPDDAGWSARSDALRAATDEVAASLDCRVSAEVVERARFDLLVRNFAGRVPGALGDAAPALATDAPESLAPVIAYVEALVRRAVDAGASDVHLEASATGLRARCRVDGGLAAVPDPPAGLEEATLNRVKLLADLDIAERRRPQDGRFRAQANGRAVDVRVSTVPTVHGESAVLRLLPDSRRPAALHALGLPADVLAGMRRLAQRPHGVILATGPTGSGKTTTLYAALQERDAGAEKIITVEDPVEYQLDGVTHVPVHRQSGVTFAAALRAILRQDPDVVMVGEMRDRETAEVAVQAAMTGHTVFATLHTNDAVGAVARLLDLGVPDYLIAETLEGVLAQRLVRRTCDACSAPYAPDGAHLAQLAGGRDASAATFRRGAGCASCRGTGFRGRVGLFELLTVSDAIRAAVLTRAPRAEVARLGAEGGMRTLWDDGWARAASGETTVEEVLRVVQMQ